MKVINLRNNDDTVTSATFNTDTRIIMPLARVMELIGFGINRDGGSRGIRDGHSNDTNVRTTTATNNSSSSDVIYHATVMAIIMTVIQYTR